MKYKYIIMIDSDFPVAAETLDDAIDYVKNSYNVINSGFNFEERFSYKDIEQDINKFGKSFFLKFDCIMTIEKYVEDHMKAIR